jgi:hypothetical protein
VKSAPTPKRKESLQPGSGRSLHPISRREARLGAIHHEACSSSLRGEARQRDASGQALQSESTDRRSASVSSTSQALSSIPPPSGRQENSPSLSKFQSTDQLRETLSSGSVTARWRRVGLSRIREAALSPRRCAQPPAAGPSVRSIPAVSAVECVPGWLSASMTRHQRAVPGLRQVPGSGETGDATAHDEKGGLAQG